MRSVSFTDDVLAQVHTAAATKGYSAEVVESCLITIAHDIGKDFGGAATFHHVSPITSHA